MSANEDLISEQGKEYSWGLIDHVSAYPDITTPTRYVPDLIKLARRNIDTVGLSNSMPMRRIDVTFGQCIFGSPKLMDIIR